MIDKTLIMAGLVALAVAGGAFAILGGDSKADQRRATLLKTSGGGKSSAVVAMDRNARKKQVTGALKELESRTTQKSLSLETRFQRAGLSLDRRRFYIFSAIAGVVLAAVVFVLSRSIVGAALFGAIGGFGLPRYVLSFLQKRRQKKFIELFPNALDVIVRGVRSGLPLADTLRIVAAEVDAPVGPEFRKIVESQTMGLTLPEAVERLTDRVPITETNFFSIVITIQGKAGGNLSEAIGNLSKVLRERKKMRGKINAMSMEAKASAGIIGFVPFGVTGMLYMTSPAYISMLWTHPTGQLWTLGAFFWMSCGIAMMAKMIKFDF